MRYRNVEFKDGRLRSPPQKKIAKLQQQNILKLDKLENIPQNWVKYEFKIPINSFIFIKLVDKSI